MIIQSIKEATREELIQRINELQDINEQHKKLNGELREEINQLKKQKQIKINEIDINLSEILCRNYFENFENKEKIIINGLDKNSKYINISILRKLLSENLEREEIGYDWTFDEKNETIKINIKNVYKKR